jgi:hypothetical protein
MFVPTLQLGEIGKPPIFWHDRFPVNPALDPKIQTFVNLVDPEKVVFRHS